MKRNPKAYVGLAQVLTEKNLHELALVEAEKAQCIDPSHAPAYHYIALCKSHLGDVEAGFTNYKKTLELKPDFSATMIALGHLEMERGNFDGARSWFNKAAERDKARLNAQIALVKLDKVTENNPDFQDLVAALPEADTMIPEQSVSYHYALGKCYEDLKRYDSAFEHFAKGAALKRSIVDFDADQIEETADDLITVFTPDLIEKLRQSSMDSSQPIFVVGMPRSGTTLTESILASHPDVFGAGELSYMHKLFADQLRGGNKKTGSLIAGLSEQELSKRVRRYVQQLDEHAPGKLHIVDKMPANFPHGRPDSRGSTQRAGSCMLRVIRWIHVCPVLPEYFSAVSSTAMTRLNWADTSTPMCASCSIGRKFSPPTAFTPFTMRTLSMISSSKRDA